MYYLGQVAYYELNIDYIIENYCVNKEKPEFHCNGKCHLAKQLQQSTPEEHSDTNTSVLLECFYMVFNNPQKHDINRNLQIISTDKSEIFSNDKQYAYLRISPLFRPPMC
ncbi:hypothetical protein [Pseudotamlana carrageenivorans]|uniref:Uncharacterized protein n=1 Tax=Pseudotamlana carrageenivorans TaxID=2069432 RepID=A0A2I7SEY9_9FLAO|nr:hypothetical protein [Tamlana carrageenivorans]AUS04469.1 hypothetical protein C1A40_02815 [Tamlana carrageenivorans]